MDGFMGVLTQHGYDAAHLMGKFQGQKYAGNGLPLDSCSDMFVYCEEASRRCWQRKERAGGGRRDVGKMSKIKLVVGGQISSESPRQTYHPRRGIK